MVFGCDLFQNPRDEWISIVYLGPGDRIYVTDFAVYALGTIKSVDSQMFETFFNPTHLRLESSVIV